MSEMLPIYLDNNTHPYLIRILYSYRPHTSPPSRQQLMENRYQLEGHCSLHGIIEQRGYDMKNELKKRR